MQCPANFNLLLLILCDSFGSVPYKTLYDSIQLSHNIQKTLKISCYSGTDDTLLIIVINYLARVPYSRDSTFAPRSVRGASERLAS